MFFAFMILSHFLCIGILCRYVVGFYTSRRDYWFIFTKVGPKTSKFNGEILNSCQSNEGTDKVAFTCDEFPILFNAPCFEIFLGVNVVYSLIIVWLWCIVCVSFML